MYKYNKKEEHKNLASVLFRGALNKIVWAIVLAMLGAVVYFAVTQPDYRLEMIVSATFLTIIILILLVKGIGKWERLQKHYENRDKIPETPAPPTGTPAEEFPIELEITGVVIGRKNGGDIKVKPVDVMDYQSSAFFTSREIPITNFNRFQTVPGQKETYRQDISGRFLNLSTAKMVKVNANIAMPSDWFVPVALMEQYTGITETKM